MIVTPAWRQYNKRWESKSGWWSVCKSQDSLHVRFVSLFLVRQVWGWPMFVIKFSCPICCNDDLSTHRGLIWIMVMGLIIMFGISWLGLIILQQHFLAHILLLYLQPPSGGIWSGRLWNQLLEQFVQTIPTRIPCLVWRPRFELDTGVAATIMADLVYIQHFWGISKYSSFCTCLNWYHYTVTYSCWQLADSSYCRQCI